MKTNQQSVAPVRAIFDTFGTTSDTLETTSDTLETTPDTLETSVYVLLEAGSAYTNG